MKLVLKILLLSFIITLAQGYKMLGVFSYCAHSHFQAGFRLMKELADRGHDVTMISCYPQKEPIKNYKDISIVETMQFINEIHANLSDFAELSYWNSLQWAINVVTPHVRNVLKTKGVQDLVKSNETFDIVIMEGILNDALAFFQYRFNCPLIIISPGKPSFYNNYMVGNPAPISYVPNVLSNVGSRMNFWQRLENVYKQLAAEYITYFYQIPKQARVLKEAFPEVPDLHSIMYNASILFTNSHVSLGDPLPIQNNIKEIGGFHVLPPKPLPTNIKEFLDNTTDGAILFSMGTIFRSDSFNKEVLGAILKVLSKMKQKVIWKIGIDLPNKPDNIMILDWLPQQDILAHPNIVGFISHGGLLGTLEAIYFGVPVLGLPVFWDQKTNVEDAVRKGFAISLNIKNLNEESFGKALNELVQNPRYRQKAQERSKIMHDRPMKQIDEAVFWVEYVIRHKGAQHLKSAALDLRWYQLHLLDIFVLVATVVIMIFWILKLIVSLLVKKMNVEKIKTN